MMKASKNAEVWSQLVHGRPLDGLGLGLRNGRIDLSGLTLPAPSIVRRLHTTVADVEVMEGTTVISKTEWRGLDFTGSRLNVLRLFDCAISDCVFDECQCQDWRLWGTIVSDTSFRLADLRGSALGGVQDGKRNTFRNVNFTSTDLRDTAHFAAVFIGCTFKHARLTKVDFQGSSFTDCSFEGEMREVQFHRKAFRGEAFPPNEMTGVDFSRAQLRSVEFRGLDMDKVRFPEDEDHIILKDYTKTLDSLLVTLAARSDLRSKKMAAYLGVFRKWAGPRQNRGVLNKSEILELFGEEGLKQFLQLLKS